MKGSYKNMAHVLNSQRLRAIKFCDLCYHYSQLAEKTGDLSYLRLRDDATDCTMRALEEDPTNEITQATLLGLCVLCDCKNEATIAEHLRNLEQKAASSAA